MTERESKAFWQGIRDVFVPGVITIFVCFLLSLLFLTGCSTPNYGGVCTVNARLMGEC